MRNFYILLYFLCMFISGLSGTASTISAIVVLISWLGVIPTVSIWYPVGFICLTFLSGCIAFISGTKAAEV